MSPSQLRAALPWLIGLSVSACAGCLALALYLAFAERANVTQNATRQMSVQADTLARELEGDLAQFDLALREASSLPSPSASSPSASLPSSGTPVPAKAGFQTLPLTARYLGFMNVLNEVGDVIADSRSNVSRPVNFAGRDYFQDHLKNPADVLMIGRPFAVAPNQHPSIPISRRLSHPDGGFAGVVVAGIHLTWLSDLLSHPLPGPPASVTIRRDDGVILMRAPPDTDSIGRGGDADPAWQAFLRTGLTAAADDQGGVRVFRRIGSPALVLELTVDRAALLDREASWLIWLPLLALIPGFCVLGLVIASRRLLRRGDQVEAAARAANDEHMRLLANMSHELRTPLTGILGQAELMAEEGTLSDRLATRLTRLTEAGTLMRNIINRVIDVARPDDRADAPVLAPCDLGLLISTCLGMVEGEARRKNLLLSSSIDPDTPRNVMLARDLVQQVLINLLMNAVKFTAAGTVSLRATGDAARLWFEVSDTGPGIPARKRRRLFREYDRLDLPESRGESTGLGLSITERFVLRMGGRIGSIERKGGGSVFWVELPTAEAGRAVPQAADNAPPVPEREIRHLRILLADDLDLTRAVTADYLRTAGHGVTECPDGETALAELRKRDFDMILTDMRMPVVDGLELTRRIRALPGHKGRTPVVLVTADLVALGFGESGQAGVDVCVRKPFTRAELLAAVEAAGRLTPVPNPDFATDPYLEQTGGGALKAAPDDAAFATRFDGAASRIEDLLARLDSPDGSEDPMAWAAVHDLIGVTGLMGLTELAEALHRFDTARDKTAPAAALAAAATEALRMLRRNETVRTQPA